MTTIPTTGAAVPATLGGSAAAGAATATGAGSGATTPPSSTNPLNQLDNTQTFLDLLVAQLKNQNPSNPANPTTFMTEISQLAAVESQTNLASEEQVVAADSMIGLSVKGGSGSGAVSGVVTGVLLSSSGAPQLEIGSSGTELSLSNVTSVSKAGTGSSGATGATAAAGSSGSTTSTGTGTSTGATGSSGTGATAGSG